MDQNTQKIDRSAKNKTQIARKLGKATKVFGKLAVGNNEKRIWTTNLHLYLYQFSKI